MAFTEFCCRSGGSNLNAGTRTGDTTEPGTAADLTYASGNWVQSTGVFTVASGDPVADGVAVGDFASVYADGSSQTGFVGRVTARTTTTITVSLTAKSGTAPTDGTGNRTLKIGGAWAGPNGANAFPFAFIENTMMDSSSNRPRVNLKNDATYSISSGITHAATNMCFQGYSSTYGDGGRWTLDGSTNAIVLLTLSGGNGLLFGDAILSNNGTTGTNTGLALTGDRGVIFNVTVHDIRGSGIAVSGADYFLAECEAYACNQSNTSGLCGIQIGTAQAVRCVSHDNTGSNSSGFRTAGQLSHCVAYGNGGDGFLQTGNGARYIACDAYENGGDGIDCASLRQFYISNCNLVKNGGYGVVAAGANHNGYLANNGFGSGTMANTSGETNVSSTSAIIEIGSVTYAADATPWNDPDNGDFSITLASSKGTGRGVFGGGLFTGYPDIGAAQHQDAGGGGGRRRRLITVS